MENLLFLVEVARFAYAQNGYKHNEDNNNNDNNSNNNSNRSSHWNKE